MPRRRGTKEIAMIRRRALGKRGQTAIAADVHATLPIESAAEDLMSCAQEAAPSSWESARRRGRNTDDISASCPDNLDE